MTEADQGYNLEQMSPRGMASYYADEDAMRLGVVVGGSLSKGLIVRLDSHQSVEELAVGRYVVVHGDNLRRFFCMITDIVLDNTNADIQGRPPDISNDPFLAQVYAGTTVYGKVHVQPMLSLEPDGKPKPVKTIPGHFTVVGNATVEDVNQVFGEEDATHFHVGEPLELETTKINLNLKRLVERSIGVFGKSGTGKSFLTRLLLAGVIAQGHAVPLIFDMHSDYGWAASNETGEQAKGLGQLMPSKVSIFTLDAESTRRRGAKYDAEIKLPYSEIEPEDIAMLRETMSLSDAMIDAAYTLAKKWGDQWVKKLIDADSNDFDEVEASTPTRAGTLAALQRRIQRFERWAFLTPEPFADSVNQIMDRIERGICIVLEFGRYGNSLEAYILVANYITRRVHEQYVERKEKALGNLADEPRQLLIVIEEAHKFLDPRIASQTIFGIIARELRKYNVTLLIVDQRPSQIDEEVMSQIGTRVTALLDNEKDIAAVLNGISGAAGLREVLARLDTRQQAIIMGHAVPMPVVVKTRSYDEDFYAAIRAESLKIPGTSGSKTGGTKAGTPSEAAQSPRDTLNNGGKGSKVIR
ncbi:MAG: ATP-binding protein [Chloroflexota bacterium]|nr:ATP-binding protein [Chloroflexota bacterium]